MSIVSEAIVHVDAENIRQALYKVKRVSAGNIIRKFNEVSLPFGVRFEMSKESRLLDEYDQIAVEGNYNVVDHSITIKLASNIDKFLKKYNFKMIVDQIMPVVEHEFVHYGQYNKMGVGPIRRWQINTTISAKYRDELTSPHEMMAYAKKVVSQLLMSHGGKEQVKALFRDNEALYQASAYSASLANYYMMRKEQPLVWKQFLKYIWGYLDA